MHHGQRPASPEPQGQSNQDSRGAQAVLVRAGEEHFPTGCPRVHFASKCALVCHCESQQKTLHSLRIHLLMTSMFGKGGSVPLPASALPPTAGGIHSLSVPDASRCLKCLMPQSVHSCSHSIQALESFPPYPHFSHTSARLCDEMFRSLQKPSIQCWG